MSPVDGAVPFVTTVNCPVVVTTVRGCFPTTIPATAICATHDGAAAQVPLNTTTKADAGVVPRFTVINVSVPVTVGEPEPQFVVHVGAVVCVALTCVAPLPVPCNKTFATVERNSGLIADVTNTGEVNGAKVVDVNALLPSVPPAPALSVNPSGMVKVALVAGCVIVTLLTVVAVNAPKEYD